MTTNQTIDGVPRALLEQFLAGGRQCDREALRALLDAPALEADPEQWYAETPDGDSALVTRVAALCKHPSMSFHQVALLEGAISDSKSAAQPQGEPVAYRYMDCNTGTCGPTKEGGIYYAEIPECGRAWEVTTKAHGAVLIERKQHAIANGYVDCHPAVTVIVEPLYAEQPGPVAVSPTCPSGCVIGVKP